MQRDLALMLKQKSSSGRRLGLAVSKINHDLRKFCSLRAAFSDRLASVPDPNGQRFAPQLMRFARTRIAFCSRRSPTPGEGAAADRKPVPLEALVEEVRETLRSLARVASG